MVRKLQKEIGKVLKFQNLHSPDPLKSESQQHFWAGVATLAVVGYYYRLNCVPPESYVEALSPKWLFGDKALKELTKVKGGHIDRPDFSRIIVPIERETTRALSLCLCMHTEKRLCEDKAKTHVSASQKERPHQKPALPAPWPQTSRLQNSEKRASVV